MSAESATARRTRELTLALPSEVALARIGLGLAVVGFVAYWVHVALERWRNFETNAFDLGFFDQIIWNTAHGRLFATTFVPYNFAGQHIEPVLLLFAAAYRLGAGPLFLVVTQAVVAGLAAPVLFEAARRLGLRASIALALALAYLANAYLHRALVFDFHPEVMAALPVFAGVWASAARRPRLAAAFALSTLAFKEDAVFIALGLSACMWSLGQRRAALVTAGAALVWTAFAVGWLMPAVRGDQPGDLVMRYPTLLGGHDGFAGVAWLLAHPFTPLHELLASAHLKTSALFLVSSAPVAILVPWTLALLLPGLALALLSTHSPQQALEFHYAAELVPLAMLGTLLGARRLAAVAPSNIAAAAILVPALLGFLVASPASPFAEQVNQPPAEAHRAAVLEALALVPPDAVVSAQSGLLPRLSQRQLAFEFPGRRRSGEWVIVDTRAFRSQQSVAAGYDQALAEVRAHYEQVYSHDGVEVFRASVPGTAAP